MAKAPAGTPPIAPSADTATVVFIRDSGMAFGVNFAIVSQSGQLLGEAVAKSHFAVKVPSGRYFFGARGESSSVVQAEVVAGRVYYVRVVPKFGTWVAAVNLDPVKPSEPEWSRVPTWLSQTVHLVPLLPPANAQSEAVAPWVAQAWSSLAAADQLSHRLDLGDGWAASPSPTPPGTPVAAVAVQK